MNRLDLEYQESTGLGDFGKASIRLELNTRPASATGNARNVLLVELTASRTFFPHSAGGPFLYLGIATAKSAPFFATLSESISDQPRERADSPVSTPA